MKMSYSLELFVSRRELKAKYESLHVMCVQRLCNSFIDPEQVFLVKWKTAVIAAFLFEAPINSTWVIRLLFPTTFLLQHIGNHC